MKTEPLNSDTAHILLSSGQAVLVDTEMLPVLLKFKWRAVAARYNWYAKARIERDGKTIDISMHRFIARTRYPDVCHHINRNTFDNRRENLINVSKKYHNFLHMNNNLRVKFERTPTT